MTGKAGMKSSEVWTSPLGSVTADVAKRSITLLYLRSLATAASCFSAASFNRASRLARSLAALEAPSQRNVGMSFGLEDPLYLRLLPLKPLES